jgi:hypothetical protein
VLKNIKNHLASEINRLVSDLYFPEFCVIFQASDDSHTGALQCSCVSHSYSECLPVGFSVR